MFECALAFFFASILLQVLNMLRSRSYFLDVVAGILYKDTYTYFLDWLNGSKCDVIFHTFESNRQESVASCWASKPQMRAA